MYSLLILVVVLCAPSRPGLPRGSSAEGYATTILTEGGTNVVPQVDTLTEAGAKLSRPVPAGTLMVVCSGGTDSVGIPGMLGVDACIHDGIIALIDIDSVCSKKWIYYAFDAFQSLMNSTATHGGTFVNLTTDIVKNIEIAFPTLERQTELLTKILAVESAITRIASHLDRERAIMGAIANGLLLDNN